MAKYHYRYEQEQWGTERTLTVLDEADQVIGQRDPFWPAGIPATPLARKRRLLKVAREIIREYERSCASFISL